MKRTLITTFALILLASIASANNGRGGGADFGRDGGQAIVGSDGTLYIARTTVDTGTNTATTTVTAISPSGSTVWTATLATRGGLRLSGSNLISVSETRASDGTVTSTLTALSTATGAVAWTRTLSGDVTELEPFNGGTYVITVSSSTRSITALDNGGNVLWTVTA
ncbi:MAG TPA: PQQ-binding-like beta-propeller repeat protein [Thermoanaerobaculia bacterium]|jgi:hypothetical protein|nr:PQQ-binding-like beta-propeller repeat protein [Thermoanaerobaculia bacterium]